MAVARKAAVARNRHKRTLRNLVVDDQVPSSSSSYHSSKPSFVSKVKAALSVVLLSPAAFVGNKLVWSKVQNGFGGRQKCIISGGSALSQKLETFYDAAGIPIVVGYGLTETSPLVAHRRGDTNLVAGGCVGTPTYQTVLKVVDEVTREEVAPGAVGVVLARGPQVMTVRRRRGRGEETGGWGEIF